MYLLNGGGDYEPLDNKSPSFPKGDLEEYTAIAFRMGQKDNVVKSDEDENHCGYL